MKPLYEITKRILHPYGQIHEALGQCQSLLLVKPEKRLRKQNRIKTIHSSLAIEGNTLDIERVTALIDSGEVVGPKKDITEGKNAIAAYDQLNQSDSYSIKDFLRAHKVLMQGLVDDLGKFRPKQAGVMKGSEFKHIAPGHDRVPGLMKDLFAYI